MSKKEYQWCGKPVKIRFGYCMVETDKEHPLMWYNYECSLPPSSGLASVAAIEINYEGEKFCISNHEGIGYHKITNGGYMDIAHFNLPAENFSPSRLHCFYLTKFDLKGYENIERKREAWRKDNHPEEYKKLQAMKTNITKSKK